MTDWCVLFSARLVTLPAEDVRAVSQHHHHRARAGHRVHAGLLQRRARPGAQYRRQVISLDGPTHWREPVRGQPDSASSTRYATPYMHTSNAKQYKDISQRPPPPPPHHRS